LKLAIDYRSDQMSSKAYYEGAVDKSVTTQTCHEREFGCRGTNTEIDCPRISNAVLQAEVSLAIPYNDNSLVWSYDRLL
jgi:hypothetical protein